MLNAELLGQQKALSGEIQREVVTLGASGTSNYNDLENKPSINGVELVGNKTTEELGIVSKETDPTVPSYVKAIKESDIENWNNKATTGYVDQKVADLVNSAPETLDTLGEVAKAIEENADIVDALNGAIGNKADKSSVPTFTATLLEDGSYSLSITTPTGV